MLIIFNFLGDVILREEPYAAVLESIFRVNHCAHCLRKTPTPIPCYECATVSLLLNTNLEFRFLWRNLEAGRVENSGMSLTKAIFSRIFNVIRFKCEKSMKKIQNEFPWNSLIELIEF